MKIHMPHTILHSLAPVARRTGMMLALGSALIAAPMLAQDTSTAPPQQQEQSQGDMHGMHHGMHDRSRGEMEHMKRELNLTDDQVSQIKQIHEQGHDQMKALHDNTGMSQEDRREKMKDLRKDEHDKIRAVLNDEQKEKFDKMMDKRHERREDHKGMKHDHDAAPAPAPSA